MRKTWNAILIVLGCAPNKDSTPSYLMRNRVKKAISLYKKNKYDVVIFSGGANRTPIPESEIMRILALKEIPASRIVLENKSLTTIQNAVFTWEMLKDKKPKKITVLSSTFHIPRVRYIFKKMYKHLNAKMEFVGSGERLPLDTRIYRWFREQSHMLELRLFGVR